MAENSSGEQNQGAEEKPADVPQSISGLTNEQGQQVLDELMAGRKIQAIKRYRDFTHSDLKTAKDAVEEIESHLPGGRRKVGCGSAVVMLGIAVAAVLYGPCS